MGGKKIKFREILDIIFLFREITFTNLKRDRNIEKLCIHLPYLYLMGKIFLIFNEIYRTSLKEKEKKTVNVNTGFEKNENKMRFPLRQYATLKKQCTRPQAPQVVRFKLVLQPHKLHFFFLFIYL